MHARSIASRTTHRSKSRDICNMRWLIIDEISQVTAELLAQCEHNVQCMMQANGTYKNGPDGVRPWGGLNVLYVGDFQQVCINPRRQNNNNNNNNNKVYNKCGCGPSTQGRQ